jgi:serine/threonine-protein kinase RsbW
VTNDLCGVLEGRWDESAVKFTIPSDFSAGREVQAKILDDVQRHGYDAESTFAIKLALEEVLINAIKHGNKFDPKKRVHVDCTITPQQAEITIEDEGAGFERCDVPDPTDDENLTKCSGRGILLIEAYMDEVKYSNRGRRVRLVKKNVDGESSK